MELLDKISDKIRKNICEIGDNLAEFPANESGRYFETVGRKLYHIFNWTQSFYTGTAYWAYRICGDETLMKWLYGYYDTYSAKVFETPMDTMHDLGFLYVPYAVAIYKLNGDPNMKKIAVKAADELAKRFDPKGGYIRAWGRMDNKIPEYVSDELAKDGFFTEGEGKAIIDCMMNLPLLLFAGEITGHPYYTRIAECHADTTLKYFVRNDYSVCHAYLFDVKSGKALHEANNCGYAVGSHWARGTAWAVYGFALIYSYVKKEEYIDTAVNLCLKFIDECKGGLPVWDFRLPDTDEKNKDTSAAAIMMCAARKILKYTDNEKIKDFLSDTEEKIIPYIDLSHDNNGLLKEQNGNHTYASYGDYFITEYFCEKYLNAKNIWASNK